MRRYSHDHGQSLSSRPIKRQLLQCISEGCAKVSTARLTARKRSWTSWWLLRSHSWLDESVSIICLSVVTLCCSRSHLWPMLMWSRTGAITDEVNSWTGIKVLYESSIWFIASTEGGVLLSLDFDGAQVWSGFTVERERERECRPGIKALGHLEEQEPIECCSNPWTVKVGARKC